MQERMRKKEDKEEEDRSWRRRGRKKMDVRRGEARLLRKMVDKHKNTIVKCANSCIKNYTQLFKLKFKI